jgi:hypothetical protein
MMNRVLLVGLMACGEVANTDPFTGEAVVPADQQAPPGLTLVGPAWIVPGYPATFTTTGPLTSGERVSFAVGVGGVGAGPCPAPLGGQCLDIRAPIKMIGNAREAGGEAELTVTVPGSAVVGATVGFQSAAVRGPGGATSMLSNSIAVPVRAAVLGCIDPGALNYNPAASVDDGSCTYGTGTFTWFTWGAAGVVNNGRANAEAHCASLGGTLARPNSQSAWDEIKNNTPNDSSGWWIDGHNDFTCSSAFPGSPKSYQYGQMYAPTGQSNIYTGCNCNPNEEGQVVYRLGTPFFFDGCQSVDTATGNLGVMDEELTYNHPDIVGFICEL